MMRISPILVESQRKNRRTRTDWAPIAVGSLTSVKGCNGILCHAGCMWRYIPDLLATPVPRYTSFPTAAALDPYRAQSRARFSNAV